MGRPRKNPVELTDEVKEVLEETAKETGSYAELPIEDIREISVQSRAKVSLADPNYDPFKKFKTEKGMYYRALNTRPHNLRKREAEGYKTIPGSEYGDLVLAKMPMDVREAREGVTQEKTSNQKRAAVEQFKEDASRSGVKSYEDKN